MSIYLYIYYRSFNNVVEKFELCLSIIRSFNGVSFQWLDIPLVSEENDITSIKKFLISTLNLSHEYYI